MTRVALVFAFVVFSLRKRLRVLYVTNALFLSLAMLAAYTGYANLGDGIRPSLALWEKSMVLVLAPSYSEILRLYCVFFLFVPPILWALMKGYTRFVLLASFALWFLAKLGFGMTAISNSGYFDLVSWQLLFVVGICAGFRRSTGQELITKRWLQQVLVVISFLLVSVYFLIRHEHFFTEMPLSPYWYWLSTWRRTLAVTRLLDFSALAYLIYYFRGSLKPVRESIVGRGLVFLGQHSLQVFIWSVSASMIACRETSYRTWLAASPTQQAVWAVLILASCYVPAWLHLQWQRIGAMKHEPKGTLLAYRWRLLGPHITPITRL